MEQLIVFENLLPFNLFSHLSFLGGQKLRFVIVVFAFGCKLQDSVLGLVQKSFSSIFLDKLWLKFPSLLLLKTTIA